MLEAGRAGGGTVGAGLGWAASLAANCGNLFSPKEAPREAMKNKKKKSKRNAHHCLTRLGQRERGGIPFAERATQ
jgi:hypothetical protein